VCCELEKIGEEAVICCCKVFSEHLTGGAEENQSKPQAGQRFPCLQLKPDSV